LYRVALLQCKIVRDAEEPPAKILTRSALLQMPEQSQESFLHHLFGVMRGEAKGKPVAQKRVAEFFKQPQDLALHLRLSHQARSRSRGRETQIADPIYGGDCLGNFHE